MYLNRLLQNSLATPVSRLGSLAIALMISATLYTNADASVEPSDTPVAVATPPSYPDSAHVCNGCHLSTIGYLSRFLAHFPQEHGQPIVISMMNADGVRRAHTIALFSWQGQAWCRDEYFGVFSLGCEIGAPSSVGRLTSRAQTLLEKHAQALVRSSGLPLRPAPPAEMATGQRMREVTLAARIIPFPTTIYWVRTAHQELPLALFRPAVGMIAVYDPLHGTCLAECNIRSDAKVVSLVAEKLGYHAQSVRQDGLETGGALVAAALETSNTYAAR